MPMILQQQNNIQAEKLYTHPYTSIENYDILQENNANMSHYMSQTSNVLKEEQMLLFMKFCEYINM